MESLNKLLNESSNFKEMISSPTITKEDKKNVIFAIADKNNFSQILKKFLGLIAIKNRLFFLSKIITSFLDLVSENKGELKAKLTIEVTGASKGAIAAVEKAGGSIAVTPPKPKPEGKGKARYRKFRWRASASRVGLRNAGRSR